ncbi:MAG: DUF4330 family protein [Candidatus Omnitrophota bacterium]|nr:DUF4330 family protein [Candidatus Omnitrophota bacterium]
MKIIDEKGRIFGRINVIDFLVILFLLLLIPMLYFGSKLLIHMEPVVEKKTRIIQVKFLNIIPEIDRVLKIGDIDVDGGRGRLEAILSNRPTNTDSSNRDILALVKISYDEKAGTLSYKQVPVRIGSPFSFTTDFYGVSGMVIDLGTGDVSHKREKPIEIEVRFSNIIPELARVFRIGDTDTDLKDMETGKLKVILSDKPTETLELKQSSLTQDQHMMRVNSLNRDVVALFDVICEENSGTLFYKGVPVRIGSSFSFTTNFYSISGVVIGIRNK